jgi:uncharacterized membrane protein (DUF373 family)
MADNDTSGMPKLLQQAEHYIYITAGFILVIAAAGLIIIGVVEMVTHVFSGNYVKAMIQLLDRILLVLMVAEVVYTIGRITRTQMLEVTPFLIIGIIAAVRRMLIITAETTGHFKIDDPAFLAALAELGVLAILIFLFALAMRLLRTKKSVE